MSTRSAYRIAVKAFVGAACAAIILTGGSAWAQIGEDLLPPLEASTDPLELLPTPLPSNSAGGAIDETGDTIDDTIDDLSDGGGDDGDDGGTEGDPGTDPGTDPGGPDQHGDPSDGSGPSSSGGGPTGGDDHGGSSTDGGTSETSGTDTTPLGGSSAPPSYGSAAAHATLATAQRALRLAGPLAAPLLFGVLAVAGLFVLGRGSDGLLKIDHMRGTGRSFRL